MWLPRESFELVEKLRDVVLNRPDYLSTVLCRDRRVIRSSSGVELRGGG